MKITKIEIENITNNHLTVFFSYYDERFYLSVEIINDKQNMYKVKSASFFNKLKMGLFKEVDKNKEYILGTLMINELITMRNLDELIENRYQVIEELEIEFSNRAVIHLLKP